MTGSVAPKHTYLVQMAKGTGGTTALPTPDAIGGASMSGTDGRIDLTSGTTVIDRVGYGSANLVEGYATPSLTNTVSATRNASCVDTADNAADFRATDPTPENSAVDMPGCSVIPTLGDPETIAQIQSTTPDDNYGTAEGLFVYTGKAPITVTPGDALTVDGSIFDFRPGGSSGSANLTTTELAGKWQQPVRFSEPARHLQAQEIRSFLDLLLAADPNANVVVLGDINDFEFSRTVDIMVGSGANAIVDLPRMLPVNERYSYVYEGNSQVLDQILISRALTIAPPGAMYPAYVYDIVHTNSEFYDQDSDHDPQVVRLAIRGDIG